MSKARIVAVREYLAIVRTKAFLVSLILTPVLGLVSVLAVQWLASTGDERLHRVRVHDATAVLSAPLLAAAAAIGPDGPRIEIEALDRPLDEPHVAELAEEVRKGTTAMFVEISAEALAPEPRGPTVLLYGEGLLTHPAAHWIRGALDEIVRERRMAAAGLDPGLVRRVTAPLPIETVDIRTLASKERRSGAGVVAAALPLVALILVLISAMSTLQPALNGVLEEKQQRIAEVLLGAVEPTSLMLGKLAGSMLLGTTLLLEYVVVGTAVAAWFGHAGMIPVGLVAWMVVDALLAMACFGAIFLAIGSACNQIKDTENLLTPILLAMLLPLVVTAKAISEPLGAIATWTSLIPPFSALLMPVRLAASSAVPWWQPWLGAAVMAGFTLLCVFAAGRIFRVGILFRGTTPSLARIVRWAMKD